MYTAKETTKVRMLVNQGELVKNMLYDAVCQDNGTVLVPYKGISYTAWYEFSMEDAGSIFKIIKLPCNSFYRYITIPEEQNAFLEKLLNMTGDEIYDRYGYKRDETITYEARFNDNMTAEIRLVLCEGGEYPYVEGILYDVNYSEVCVTDCTEHVTGIWEFEDEGIKYIVEIKSSTKNNSTWHAQRH